MGNVYKAIDENPGALLPTSFNDNPYLRFLRSGISPSSSLLWDVADGKNYIGEEVNLEWQNIGKEAANKLLPFWLSEYAESALEGSDMPGPAVSAAEFMGARAWPVQTSEEVRALRNQLAQQSYTKDWYGAEGLTRGEQNKLRRQSPELQQLEEQKLSEMLQKGVSMEVFDDRIRAEIRKLKRDKLEELADAVLKGTIDRGDYAYQSRGIREFFSGMYEGVERSQLAIDPKDAEQYDRWVEENQHPYDKALSEYYEKFDSSKFGYNFEQRDAARQKWLYTQPVAARKYIRYMTEQDWIFDLGPKAQQVERMGQQTTPTRTQAPRQAPALPLPWQ